MNYHYSLIAQSNRISTFISGLPHLRQIYTLSYFQKIKQQIKEMKRNDNFSGPIDSMFILMCDDEEKEFTQLLLLEKYLTLIYRHSSVKKTDKQYLISELHNKQSLNILFEISIIGNLLNQLSFAKVDLYPETSNLSKVDISIKLEDRPIYIEISVLGESEKDVKIREEMTKHKRKTLSTNRDLERDKIRFHTKINYKIRQFAPRRPNVLIISKFDFFPINFTIDSVMTNNCFINVGLILLFDRKNIKTIYKNNIDPTCNLTLGEYESLIKLFKNNQYQPISYGTIY